MSKTDSNINLTELLADREAGTDGPWLYSPERHTHDSMIHQDLPVGKYGYYDLDSGGVVGSSEWTWLDPVNARRIARLPDLEAAYIEAVELLRRFVEVNDEPCRHDHHGYCQAHNLEEDCMVDAARKFIMIKTVA